MSSLNEKLVTIFVKAKRLNEAIWTGDDAGRLSIDRLKVIVSELYAVDIEMYEVDFEGSHLRGMIEVYNGGRNAKIYVRKNQNDLWRRYVAVKELCHVVIDRKEDWSPHVLDTLERLIVGDVLGLVEHNGALSEKLAEMIALELIYPHEDRRKDLAKVVAKEISDNDIALAKGLPREMVQRVLSQPYLTTCDILWRSVTLAERQHPDPAE